MFSTWFFLLSKEAEDVKEIFSGKNEINKRKRRQKASGFVTHYLVSVNTFKHNICNKLCHLYVPGCAKNRESNQIDVVTPRLI